MGPTTAYIYHDYLEHNIALIRQAVGSRKIMAVVKANAYGHGDVEVAQTALSAGCEYLGVAFVEEGVRLRQAGISAPILVFGAQLTEFMDVAIDHDLELTITSMDQIARLKTINRPVSVHLKLDTGMNRVGFSTDQFERAVTEAMKIPHIMINGIYSHLATADEADTDFAALQISRFEKIQNNLKDVLPGEVLFHLANSAAIMKFPQAYFDMVRPGIMLYGQPPSVEFELDWQLKEVMSLRSRLGLIKMVRKNDAVSYGRRYYASEDTHIGVIPAGYADGLSRGLTNNARVVINNRSYPLVGTVCMDMVMVNLGAELKCKTGDAVLLYGIMGPDRIPIREISKNLHTIPYEITCNVSARVPRKHLQVQIGG